MAWPLCSSRVLSLGPVDVFSCSPGLETVPNSLPFPLTRRIVLTVISSVGIICTCFPACRVLIVHFFSKPQDSSAYAQSYPKGGTPRRKEKNGSSGTTTLGGSTFVGTTTSNVSTRKHGKQCYPNDDDVMELTKYPGSPDSDAHNGSHRIESTLGELDNEHKCQRPREEKHYV